MDFFNKLGNNIQNVGKEVTKKTKDLGGVVSLSAQIKESESNLNKVYQTLGEKVYAASQENLAEKYPDEVAQIQMYLSKIAEDKEQLRVLKGIQVCPNCGAEVENTAAHCQMCGTSLKTVQVDSVASVSEASPSFCPNCGASIGQNVKFCQSCGTRVGE